ncbi:hypothetical protein NDU88_004125 [Pleurodeles waltl]|uniref:CCHC-type domain-containing protein n=1 Tax=Pleurodeles waltl TaxID=8319 RepID=A0AAV7M5G0_PLEWA|nr:hypothetical protein NDU88_004125 [Pleurodeles waltl]
MNLADIDMLMGNVVPQTIWAKIRREDHAQELGGDWNAIIAADRGQVGGAKPDALISELPGRIITLMKTMMPALRVNWDKLAACKQKKDESVSDFFTRFEETFIDHSGQDMATEGGQRLFVDKFVYNLLPELSHKLKDSESSWAVSSSAQILATAQYYENRDKEEREKQEKKTKELKTKVLLQQAYPPRYVQPQFQQPPQFQRLYQKPEPFIPRPLLGPNQCAYCREEGHFKNSCPALLQRNGATSASRGRGGPQSANRGRGRGVLTQEQRSFVPGNYFDQQNVRSTQYYSEDQYIEGGNESLHFE